MGSECGNFFETDYNIMTYGYILLRHQIRAIKTKSALIPAVFPMSFFSAKAMIFSTNWHILGKCNSFVTPSPLNGIDFPLSAILLWFLSVPSVVWFWSGSPFYWSNRWFLAGIFMMMMKMMMKKIMMMMMVMMMTLMIKKKKIMVKTGSKIGSPDSEML